MKQQIKAELQSIGISLCSDEQYVRWIHDTNGVQYSTIEQYRKECGEEVLSDQLQYIVPCYL